MRGRGEFDGACGYSLHFWCGAGAGVEEREEFGCGGFVEADEKVDVGVDAGDREVVVEPEEQDFVEAGAEELVKAGGDAVAVDAPGLFEHGGEGLEGGSPVVGAAKAADAKLALGRGDGEVFERPEESGVEGAVERLAREVVGEAFDEMLGRPVEQRVDAHEVAVESLAGDAGGGSELAELGGDVVVAVFVHELEKGGFATDEKARREVFIAARIVHEGEFVGPEKKLFVLIHLL